MICFQERATKVEVFAEYCNNIGFNVETLLSDKEKQLSIVELTLVPNNAECGMTLPPSAVAATEDAPRLALYK